MRKAEIDDSLLDRICILAKLELSGEERAMAKEDLGKMVEYLDQMERAEVSNVEPLHHVLPDRNVLREDVPADPSESAGKCRLIENAPEMQEGYFVVPRTIGEKGKDE